MRLLKRTVRKIKKYFNTAKRFERLYDKLERQGFVCFMCLNIDRKGTENLSRRYLKNTQKVDALLKKWKN